ncbi:transposase [Streptomyces sp. NPDC094468]|uniref:transposase n=1 Tax=Streptomyces sp. NPDC094468 TaxID=3366066 RepID=UPI00380B81EF
MVQSFFRGELTGFCSGPKARHDRLGRCENTGPMPAPRKYPDELRERAVREVQTSGRPDAHVAKDLGIHKEALRGCVRQAEADKGDRPVLLTTAERIELGQLCKEIAELRRANEIPRSL